MYSRNLYDASIESAHADSRQRHSFLDTDAHKHPHALEQMAQLWELILADWQKMILNVCCRTYFRFWNLALFYCITLKSPDSSGSCAQNFWALRWCSAGKPNMSRIASSLWSGCSGLNTWKVKLRCLNAAFAGDSRNEWCKSSALTFQMDMPAMSNGRTASGLICMPLLHIMHWFQNMVALSAECSK